MKKIFILSGVLAILSCGQSDNSEPEQLPIPTKKQKEVQVKPEVAPENKQEIVLSIEGMTCPSCQHTIQEEVLKMPGVVECKVSLSDKNAVVVFDKTTESPEKIIEQIQSIENGAYKASILTETQTLPSDSITSNVGNSAKTENNKKMFSQLPHFELPNLFAYFLDFIR
jgi:Cu+-exporting ATPase